MDRIFRFPWLIIGVVLAITAFFAVQLPKVELENDVLTFIPENHPDKLAFERLDDLYDLDLSIAVAVHRPYRSILEPDSIDLVHELTERFEEIPHVTEVTSLTNIDYIAGTEAGLESMPLTRGYDGSSGSIKRIRQRLNDWPAYDGTLVSDDLHAAQMAIALDAGLEAEAREEVYFTILDILEPYQDDTTEFYVAGEPAITVLLSSNMRADMIYLIPAVVLVVIGVLTIFFRRVAGVVLPLVTVLISTTWTVGLMALLGIKLSLMATVIPVLMVAVGSAYGIHIVNHYFHHIDAVTGELSRDEHKRIIFLTLRSVGLPVFMAGLTTIVGFGALATSEVIPMRDFGIFTALGVLAALIVALALIPSLLLVRRRLVSRKPRSVGSLMGMSDEEAKGVFVSLYRFFGARKGRIMIAALLISGAAVYGALQVIVDNELIAYFKANTQIRRADEFLREKFLGTRSFDINVVGEEPGALTNPEILKAMDDLAQYLESTYTEVSKVVSYTDFIKRMNQVMNADVPPPEGYPAALVAGARGVSEDPLDQSGQAGSFSDTGPDGSGTGEGSDGSFGGFSGDGFGGAASSGSDESFGGFSGEGFGGSGESDGDSSFGGFSGEGFGGSDSGGFGGSGTSAGSGGFGSTGSSASNGAADASGSPVQAAQPATAAGADQGRDAAVVGSPQAIAAVVTEALADAERGELTAEELMRHINRRLNYRGWAYYEVPYDPSRYPVETRDELSNLISQYLLLYSGELTSYADDALEPRQARMTVQLRTTGNIFTAHVTEDVERYVRNNFPEGYSIEISGVAIVERSITGLITDAQIRSILISLTLVFIIVSFAFRSAIAGLFGIVPLSLTLLVNFGVMGYLGIKLDAATAMVSSIAIGIGIDYTIHLLSSYYNERQMTDDLEQVEIRVLSTTGKAITFNALSVAAGFAVLIFSQFNPLKYMGGLIAITMLTSSIASLTVLPVLLDLFKPRFMQPKEAKS